MDQKSAEEIHYLDIMISKRYGSCKTGVYRKPSYKMVLIPNWSNDPLRYKKAAFRSLFRRALEYCSDIDLNKELQGILEIGFKHGYRKSFFNGNSRRKILRSNTETVRNNFSEERKYLPVPSNLRNTSVIGGVAGGDGRCIVSGGPPTIFGGLHGDGEPVRRVSVVEYIAFQ